MGSRYIIGDVFAGLASLPDDSVDLVFTSPPFLALRSYLPADHPDKAREIGSEPTPAAFIDTLLDVTEALERVLAPHGSLCVELGDTYSGSGGGGGDYLDGGWREGQQQFAGSASSMRESNAAHWRQKNQQRNAWPLAKSLCLIPESYRWALTYGRNPFNGRETPPWRVRNVVRWHRPNPPVGALGDKFRPSTSDVVVATKSRTRYFDLDAVRGPGSPNTHARLAQGIDSRPTSGKKAENPNNNYWSMDEIETVGAPPLDTWIIPTEPYSGSHYATFPSALVVKPVLAMCPESVCVVCGSPRRRIVEATQDYANRPYAGRDFCADAPDTGVTGQTDRNGWRGTAGYSTLGWTDCGHDNYRRGVVLDPFAGSGTTLAVATGHGRDAIGIDLDERNADLARERVGMFLTIEGLLAAALSNEGGDDG
jgi:site-specific DNA-methyltransferase (cytosine-N4-specific)